MWQFTPVTWLFVISACLSITLAIRTWQMRPARGATFLSALAMGNAIWSLGYILGFFNTVLAWKLVFLRVEYLGILGTIFFYPLCVLTLTHYERWVNRYTIAALAVVPLVAFALILTVQSHEFFYRSYGLRSGGELIILDKGYGPGFWFSAAYAYTVILLGAVMLVQAMIRFPGLYRGQVALLVPAALIPLVPNVLYITGRNPFAPYDISSITFMFSALLIFLSMQRYHLLGIIPVAYDLVFNQVSSGVLVVDNQTRLIDLNPEAERILAQSRDEVIGKSLLEILPEYRDYILRFQNVLETETEINMGEAVYELRISPLTDRAGRLAGRVIILHDITQRKRLIEDLDAYAHMVAHDLMNPVSLVIGYTEMLKEDWANMPEAKIQEMLDMIAQSGQKTLDIINGLLLLANVRHLDEVKTEPLAMAEIVQSALDRILLMVEETKAEIIVHHDETWPTAVGYAAWVEEVWTNYISNAIKYGGSPPRVELGATAQENGMIRFWVRDNGPGLDAAQQARLFYEFTRLDKTRAPGYGLGLSIVQRIVEKLGGEVSVESATGQGSTFSFTLPAAAELSTTPQTAVHLAGENAG